MQEDIPSSNAMHSVSSRHARSCEAARRWCLHPTPVMKLRKEGRAKQLARWSARPSVQRTGCHFDKCSIVMGLEDLAAAAPPSSLSLPSRSCLSNSHTDQPTEEESVLTERGLILERLYHVI